jgi:hypothetical protein
VRLGAQDRPEKGRPQVVQDRAQVRVGIARRQVAEVDDPDQGLLARVQQDVLLVEIVVQQRPSSRGLEPVEQIQAAARARPRERRQHPRLDLLTAGAVGRQHVDRRHGHGKRGRREGVQLLEEARDLLGRRAAGPGASSRRRVRVSATPLRAR